MDFIHFIQAVSFISLVIDSLFQPVTANAHANGSIIIAQLWHQGRQSHSSFNGGAAPVSASNVPLVNKVNTANRDHGDPEVPHALTQEEINAVIQVCGQFKSKVTLLIRVLELFRAFSQGLGH